MKTWCSAGQMPFWNPHMHSEWEMRPVQHTAGHSRWLRNNYSRKQKRDFADFCIRKAGWILLSELLLFFFHVQCFYLIFFSRQFTYLPTPSFKLVLTTFHKKLLKEKLWSRMEWNCKTKQPPKQNPNHCCFKKNQHFHQLYLNKTH